MTIPAVEPAQTKLAVLDNGTAYELFEVIAMANGTATVRTPYRFELGEELSVRVEQAGQVYEARAKVRAHTDDTTQLELRRI